MIIKFQDLFLNQISSIKDSNTLAFHIGKQDYSYSQFYDIIEQVYAKVNNLPEDNICLYATDDIRTYATIVALWFSGKAYVPLNPNQPIERHLEVIESVGAHYVVSSDEKYDCGVEGMNYIRTNEIAADGYQSRNIIKIVDVPDSKLAYLLFTSGSTGKPKGVQITRGNVAAFIDSMDRIGLDITPEDKCLQPFDLTFDFSVSSYVIPLAKGASIYTVPAKAVKFTYIAGLLEEHHLTVLQMVPSMIRNLLPYLDEVDLSSVRYNILCGEALTGKVIKGWHKGNPKMVSYNMYGPTEDTVFCTYYKVFEANVESPLAANDIVSIGKTFENSGLLILDDNDKIITATNVEGELCLCGDQLTPGYWKNDKENAAKFLTIDGVRYYRTGDLVYYAEDGNIMFVSRKDFQVKINGFRVELGEIENTYSSLAKGKFCVVMPFVNQQGNTALAIIIEGREYDYQEHKKAMSQILPAYEVPDKWLFIKTIPLNQNGKVDRKEIKKTFNI